jgi:hypothetical protein
MSIELYDKSIKAFDTTTAARGDVVAVRRGAEDFRNALINSISDASLVLVDANAGKSSVTPGQIDSGAVTIDGAVNNGSGGSPVVLAVETDFPPDDFGNVGQYALTATGRLWKKVTRPEVYNLNITAATPEQDLFNALIGAWTAHDTPLEEDFPDVFWPTYSDAKAPYYTADFMDGLALVRRTDGNWEFITTVDGLSIADWNSMAAGTGFAGSYDTDALLPTEVTTWHNLDGGDNTQITFEIGGVLPAQDVWEDMTRPDAFAPRFAGDSELEIAPGIYFGVKFDYVNEWWYSTLTADTGRSFQADNCMNYAGTSASAMSQSLHSIDGSVTLCTYSGGGTIYMDGTLGLSDMVSSRSLGFFHLTATRQGNGRVILESRRLG